MSLWGVIAYIYIYIYIHIYIYTYIYIFDGSIQKMCIGRGERNGSKPIFPLLDNVK